MTDNAQQKAVASELEKAMRVNDVKAVEELLQQGADFNEKTVFGGSNGWNILQAASYCGRTEIARLLIGKGADINAKDQGDLTPLLLALSMEKTDTVRMLVDNGADVIADEAQINELMRLSSLSSNEELVQIFKEAPEIRSRRAAEAAAAAAHATAIERQKRLKALARKQHLTH